MVRGFVGTDCEQTFAADFGNISVQRCFGMASGECISGCGDYITGEIGSKFENESLRLPLQPAGKVTTVLPYCCATHTTVSRPIALVMYHFALYLKPVHSAFIGEADYC